MAESKLEELPISIPNTEPNISEKHAALCKLHVEVVNDLEDAKRTIQQLLEEKEQTENEYNALNEQHKAVSVELQIQIEANKENMDKLQLLQSKYDDMSTQNSSTLGDIIDSHQNADDLVALQAKYDEIVQENKNVMEAMSELIIETQTKIEGETEKYEQTLNEYQQQIDALNDENIALSKQNETNSQKLNKYAQNLKSAMSKLKRYKASNIENEQKFDELNKKLNKNEEANNELNEWREKYNALEQKMNEKSKEFETKKLRIKNKYKAQINKKKKNQKYDELMKEFEALHVEKNKLMKDYDLLQSEHKIIKSELSEIRLSHKESLVKYKEKAKNAVNKHKSNKIKEVNDITSKYQKLLQQTEQITQNLTKITLQNEKLTEKNQRLQSWQDNMSSNIMSLTNKLETKQKECDKLNHLKQINSDFEKQIAALQKSKNELQNEVKSLQKTIEKASKILTKSGCVKMEKSMDFIQRINALINECERIKIECSENKMHCQQNEEKFKESQDQNEKLQKNIKDLQNKLNTQSISSLNDSLHSLSKQMNTLKQTNDSLQSKMKSMNGSNNIKIEQMNQQNIVLKKECNEVKNKLQQREKVLNKISTLIAKNSFFNKSNNSMSMSLIQAVRSLIENYENMQEKMKKNLNVMTSKSEKYFNALQIIHSETLQSLEKWKNFGLQRSNDKNIKITTKKNVSNVNVKQCVADVQSLNMFFTQTLDLYQQKKEQNQRTVMELQTNLNAVNEENKSKTKYVKKYEKMSRKLNHCIACMKENWNYNLTKADFIDLTVSMRIMAGDRIWCLIRWRHKNNEDNNKYADEYFWCLQAVYLQKLNCNKDEVYLPDFYQNKVENQIGKKLESKYKGLIQQNDEEIKALKEDVKRSQHKLRDANKQNKELKHRLSVLPNYEKYKEKYHLIERELSIKQDKIRQIEEKILGKDEEIKMFKDQLKMYENEKINAKKKYAKKLEDVRNRARQMLEAKDKKLHILQNENVSATKPNNAMNDIKIINNNYNYRMDVKYDKETQTEYVSESEFKDTMEGAMFNEGDDENEKETKAASNITIIYHQKQKIKAFEERLKRLQHLLYESEQEHKRKNVRLEELSMMSVASFEKGSESLKGNDEEEVTWNHCEYLKNALLQYFDAKISVHELLSVVTVGLRLDENELKKAKNSKMISEQNTKSWW